MSYDILTADGSTPLGAGNPVYASLTSPDPRGDTRAFDLMNADPDDLNTWQSKLITLSQESDDNRKRLTEIEGAVDWKGDGATAFALSVKQTSGPLSALAQAYHDAAWAINSYASSIEEDLRPAFQKQADLIRTYTYQLTGWEPSDDSYRPASYHYTKKQVDVDSPNFQSTLTDLQNAKTAAQGVISDFETAVSTLTTALQKAAESAPKAPPWWQQQLDAGIIKASGLKGVTKKEITDAEGLAAAELLYLEHPGNKKYKQELDTDLAAVTAIATAANKDGDKGLADQLLDDEAGSLQRLSDAEAGGVLGTGKNVTATQNEEDIVAKDLAAGNVSGAEKELQTMATSAETTQKGAPTSKATTAAETQADGQTGTVTKELGGSTSSNGTGGGTPTSTTTGDTSGNTPDADQSKKINEMLNECSTLKGDPYVWGGGHNSGFLPTDGGFDCSGFVSKVLHSAGYLSSPQDTEGFAQLAQQSGSGISTGKGQFVTIYDRSIGAQDQQHVIIDINGQWWECGGNPADGGANYVVHIPPPNSNYLSEFNSVLHPTGL